MRKEINFTKYPFTWKERLLYGGGGSCFICLLGKLFYGTGYAAVFLIPLLILFLMQKKRELKRKRQQELQIQFKDFLIAISSSLITGYSVENALKQAEAEMEKMYGKNGYITLELVRINREIHLNIPAEEAFRRCGVRTGLEEILLFSEVFQVAKQSGGDLVEIIKKTAGRISERIEVKREMLTLISGKKMEQRLLTLAPIGIIMYIEVSSPGYFSVMYGNPSGILIMTVCLIMYFVSWMMGERLVAIEI